MPASILPPDDPTPENWQLLYRQIAHCLSRWDSLANPIGLFRHPKKGALLLPENAPFPDNIELVELLKPTYGGLILAGIPIGTDAYCRQALDERIDIVRHRAQGVCALALHDKQIALRLLGRSLAHAMDYISSNLPMSTLQPTCLIFDDIINDTLTTVLCPNQIPPPCPPDRLLFARRLAAVKCEDGGFDIQII